MMRHGQTFNPPPPTRGDDLGKRIMNRNQFLEALEDRIQFAVTAAFIPTIGQLSIFGDAQNNTIVVSRNAAGTVLVNGGAVPVVGGTPTVANVSLISIFGL